MSYRTIENASPLSKPHKSRGREPTASGVPPRLRRPPHLSPYAAPGKKNRIAEHKQHTRRPYAETRQECALSRPDKMQGHAPPNAEHRKQRAWMHEVKIAEQNSAHLGREEDEQQWPVTTVLVLAT